MSSLTQARESRRPRGFAILLVVIVGSMWWMADARAKIERAEAEAVEYGRPLPASFAASPATGDDSLVSFDDEGPRYGPTSMSYTDGDVWTWGYEAL